MRVVPSIDRAIAILLGVLALCVYAAALPPSYAFWDTGELQTVSIILGIEHPPGSPAFVLLAWLFTHAFPFGDRAWRVNLFASIAVAVSVGILFSTMRVMRFGRAVSVVCSLAFAFSSITLVYATRAEGHDLVLCFSAVALYFIARYDRDRSLRDLFFSALALGLLGATHGVAIFLVPALALAVALRRWPHGRAREAVLAVVGGVALGLLPYAYIAPRSAWLVAQRTDPTLSLGLPPGTPFWDYGDPHTLATFWAFVTGAQFHVHSGFAGYLQFDRYVGYGQALVRRLGAAYGYVGTVLASVGAALLVARRDAIGKVLVVAALSTVPYTEAYSDLQDPDRYYLLALWCAAIAIGFAFERIVPLFVREPPRIVRAALVACLFVMFAVATDKRSQIFNQRGDTGAPDYVAYLRTVTPDNAIVLAEWAYSSPTAYASFVEHSFGDRIPVSSGPEQYIEHYDDWLKSPRPLYIVSFDDDLHIPKYETQRISFDKSFYVYRITH